MNTKPQPTKLFNVAIIIALLLTPIWPSEAQQLTGAVAPAASDVSDQQVPVNRVPTVSGPSTGATTNTSAFPAATLSAEAKFHLNASEHFIVINSSGVEPATINVEVGDSVTWHNATGTTVRIKSGTPPDDPGPSTGGSSIFLPLINGGAQSVVSAEQSTIPPVTEETTAVTAAGGGDIDTQLAPGADFTYTFDSAGTIAYYLDRSGYPTGRVLVESPRPTTILESSPANGEDGVAATRETIIEFTRPINAAGVTAANFVARFGSRTLNARLHHSADGKRVTLFYDPVLPASARIQVTVNGGGITDSTGQKIDGDGDGQPGGAATIDFDTLSVTVVPGTSVCGRVFASELAADGNTSVNVPLQGATITVDGMESTLKSTTNSEGNFCLDPAPAGRFFVHIDGRTARNGVPAGAYYPFVGKAWGSVVGKQSSVGNIYLPLVQPGTLQDVSNTQETRITFADSVRQQFPEFTGTEIYVPANSLMRDDGSRGGRRCRI
ncbi:MAG: Ig-like domain-containing protein, partial [Caldilineaceae bacterium]|nr:Ig-like domain-containing protein [Caldilineaceae bacterium]